MNVNPRHSHGFSLIELLVAATIFSFVVAGVSGLFVQALDLQRRAGGIQKIQENAQYVLESIAREVRVSKITGPDTNCNPSDASNYTLTITHPVNGTVTYAYDSVLGIITRNAGGSGPQPITTTNVFFKKLAFCVSGSGADKAQARVTIPMTIESTDGRTSNRVSVSLQTTIISRDLTTELTQ
jgi:prepilin-type N-terminal cleavage/methylation domain-containing protein